MTKKPTAEEMAAWRRKLNRATTAHEKTRAALDALVADARKARVPLTFVAEHTPYSREWARKIADKVDAERAAAVRSAKDKPEA